MAVADGKIFDAQNDDESPPRIYLRRVLQAATAAPDLVQYSKIVFTKYHYYSNPLNAFKDAAINIASNPSQLYYLYHYHATVTFPQLMPSQSMAGKGKQLL